MSFQNPPVLWALLGVLPLGLLSVRGYLFGIRDVRRLMLNTDRRDLERLITVKWVISTAASLLMFASLVFALADPVWGEEIEDSDREELDIAITFDVSRSMYADDVEPTRLEAARKAVAAIVDGVPGARVSLTLFRGAASRVLPMTEDRAAFDYAMSVVSPSMITSPGTDIAAGLLAALESLPSGSNRNRAIVLVSDGEALTGNDLAAAEEAAALSVPVFVIGVGSREGSRIRLPDGSFVEDSDGRVVISRLDETRLQRIAELTRGRYVNLSDSGAIATMEAELSAYEDGAGDFRAAGIRRYSLFAAFALCFAVIQLIARIVRWRDMF